MTPNAVTASMPVIVTATELAGYLEGRADVTILDVRTPAEFESAHIPGSYNVPLDTLSEHSVELASAVGGPVVLVCRSGMRAQQAGQTLQGTNLQRLHILEGGLSAWESASLPMNRGKQRWSMERQVRGVAGAISLTGAFAGLFLWRPATAISAGVGTGLLLSALTDSCTMAKFLAKVPYNQGVSCDVSAVINDIARDSGEDSALLAAD
jgi:rhodanese-related sulfurtransferase